MVAYVEDKLLAAGPRCSNCGMENVKITHFQINGSHSLINRLEQLWVQMKAEILKFSKIEKKTYEYQS